jgi:hypothetical protein
MSGGKDSYLSEGKESSMSEKRRRGEPDLKKGELPA